ncbi:hypothetical protein HU200_038484 [Digitaria exilis]|uniref:Uncharacterized protein n=1 Tax=Digitaria exilis TaxID=1010633 RepID=A0A835EJ50_9POAL|nr:hypothetical protein HU200_038484 [Digitaria exilis]
MSGLFASLSIGKAWEKLSSLLRVFSMVPSSSSSASQQEDLEELRKLERTMRRIRATLHDAEEHWNIREESAKLRLKELKEVAYDIEDLVDEYDYEANRCKVLSLDRFAGIPNTGKRKHHEVNVACSVDACVVAVPHDLVIRARKITERFNEIVQYSEHFRLSADDGERRFAPDITSLRHTSSVVFEASILGRDQDKDKITDKLLSREGENAGSPVSVMAIVGMGGLGKTTLAQLVYNDPRVRQSFDKDAWVCVSEHFDVNAITRNIFTALTSKQCIDTQLATLQKKLAEEIKERRVLLVLDDVWNERRDSWELFCAPMTSAKICQIIVTTRSEQVARLIQTIPFYNLNCLSFDESWLLFSKAACIGVQKFDHPTNMTWIGKSIVKRCKGLPLAIKTLGSMLRYESDERIWKDVLESELWDLKGLRDEVLPALELSYKHMPIYIRRCFVALSLFPKDCKLDSEEVLHLWKLLDLLDSGGSDDDCEIGRLYLKELAQRSILQLDSDDGSYYLLHDLIHDLACFFAGEEFYRIEHGTVTEIPQNVRYLSIKNKFVTAAEISVFPHSLRALRVWSSWGEPIISEALFSKCSKLRALDIGGSINLGMGLLDVVGHLKLLRHLSFYHHDEPSLSKDHDKSWMSAQHLLNLLVSRARNLTNLLTLPDLYISGTRCSFNIRELRNINKIREMRISGLRNIRHAEDAIEAQLLMKSHLRSLVLKFDVIERQCTCGLLPEIVTIPDDQLLDSLRPHHNLRKLCIFYYDSRKYPSWLGNASFSMLARIVLGCCGSKHLPKLGRLPSLKYLSVNSMYHMERVSLESERQIAGEKEFPSLTELQFGTMSEWSEWYGVDTGVFPRLNTLSLLACSKLSSLPLGPFQSLITLKLVLCKSLATFPSSPALRNLDISFCSALRQIPTLPSLLDLRIEGCSVVTELPVLPSILKLDVSNCPSLISIGSASSDPLILQTYHCSSPDVNTIPKLSTLRINCCQNLSSIGSFPLLSTMELRCCPNLIAVGSLPSLNTLKLMYCLNACEVCLLTTLNLKYKQHTELLFNLLSSLPSLECLEIYDMSIARIPLKQQSLPSLARLRLSNCNDLQYCDGLVTLTSLEHLEVWNCPKLNLPPLQLKTLINRDAGYKFQCL